MRKLGIGLVGIGEMGRRHAENLRRHVPEARLVAVADVAGERARQTAAELEIDRSYESLDAMLENKEIDAVLIATPDKFHAHAIVKGCDQNPIDLLILKHRIATPDKFHAQAIVKAAGAGKDILCEKP